jgi:NADPH:quinone reductase-like Zn-dependent oxidoreductase
MATMQAMTLRTHGGPEVLHLEEIPRPEPGPGEVRVKVAAVAMNHIDLWVRRGGPAFHVEYPHRLGADIVGTVDALGPGVDDLEVGARAVVQPGVSCGRCPQCIGGDDNLCRRYRILGENAQGGYGEHLVVPRVNVAPYPTNLGWVEAAAAILPFLTAWQMVVRKAQVAPGQTVLVHGGGSGVGVAAIQIARLHGAKVITTVGSDGKLGPAKALGADEVINYRTTDFGAAVRTLTGKRGVDVVLDHVGGDVLAASIRAVRVGGRVVTCGATAGFTPTIDLRHIFFRQVELLGSTMGRKADLLAVLDHLAAGRLRPVVHAVLPLAAAAEGHRILEDRAVFGKVVLAVDPSIALPGGGARAS